MYHGSKEVDTMFKKKRYLYLSEAEFRILIECLIHLKNKLTLQGRFTDCVDDLLLKVMNTQLSSI